MKNIIICFTILFLVLACNNKEREDSTVNTNLSRATDANIALNNIDSLSKEFETIGSKVKIKNALPNDQGIYIYFELVNGKAKNLKMYIQYEDHSIYQIRVDDERYTYKTDKSRGKGDAKICWYDYPVKSIDVKLLRSIVKSQNSRIVFSDGTSIGIYDDTKEAINKTLNYFEILGGVFPSYYIQTK